MCARLFSTVPFAFLILGAVLLVANPACSQEETPPGPDPRHSYDINIHFGTLIPSRFGLDDTVPGWGLRLSAPTQKGVFEASVFSGIGHGIVYRTTALDYRMDIEFESILFHFLLGLHADQYEQTDPVLASSNFAGGWHYGGGVMMPITGPLLFRFDFQQRFSPGQVVEVTVGLTYRIPEGA